MTLLTKIQAIIFDRDGTLNESGPESNGGYVLSPDMLVLLPGVKDALIDFHRRGVKMYVFTQQNCVSKGLIDCAGVDSVHEKLNALIAPAKIDGFYYNTQKNAGSDWSKPEAGMLHAIIRDHTLDPATVLVIGDAVRDAEAAAKARLDFAFVQSDQPEKTAEAKKTGLPVFTSLKEIVRALDTSKPSGTTPKI